MPEVTPIKIMRLPDGHCYAVAPDGRAIKTVQAMHAVDREDRCWSSHFATSVGYGDWLAGQESVEECACPDCEAVKRGAMTLPERM